jgi:hypothetical protein
MGAERDQDVVDRFTTGGLLSERGESAGLLPDEVAGVDISETRARETAGDLSEAGEALDAGAVTNAQALLVAPFTGGAGVQPDSQALDPTTDAGGETVAENALEGAAQVPFDAPGGALQAETAAEAGQAVAEGGIGDEGTGDVTETGIAVGRDAAARTAAQAQQNPGEFAGAVGAGLLLGGAGAASTGTAASGLRAAVRAEVDPRVGTFGTTLETRAGRGVRDFLRDDRGQADLGGLGRRDTGDGGDSGGSPTTGTGGDDGLDPELQEALDNFADSGGTDLPGNPADVRRAENQPETDIDAADPVQQRRDQARREDRGADTTTGSLGLDERPTRSSVTREDPLPGRARDRDADTVDDALDRQADARQRFDARGDSLGAGAGGLFGVASQDGRGRGDAIGGLLGTPGGVDATGTTPDLDTGGDLFGGTDIGSDTDTGIDIGSDTDTDIDIDTRIDTDQTPDIDTGDPSLDTDISDPTTRDPPTRDPRDPGSDPGDPVRRDPDVPVEFDDEDETDTDAALFGTLADADTVDSGIASVRDLLGR